MNSLSETGDRGLGGLNPGADGTAVSSPTPDATGTPTVCERPKGERIPSCKSDTGPGPSRGPKESPLTSSSASTTGVLILWTKCVGSCDAARIMGANTDIFGCQFVYGLDGLVPGFGAARLLSWRVLARMSLRERPRMKLGRLICGEMRGFEPERC